MRNNSGLPTPHAFKEKVGVINSLSLPSNHPAQKSVQGEGVGPLTNSLLAVVVQAMYRAIHPINLLSKF